MLRHDAAGADGEQTPRVSNHRTARRQPLRTTRREQLVQAWTLGRFVVAGLLGNVAHAVVFLLLGALTASPATFNNVVAVVVSTLVANELHRRFTFRGARSTSWFKGHGLGGAAAAVGLVLSTAALSAWHHVVPGAGAASALAVVHTVTGLVGLTNFLVLRRVLRPAVVLAA